MNETRTYYTKRNVIWSYIHYILTIAFEFVSRTVIVKVFGEEYLGLSSLFTSILHVLNMAELGFSSAIVYNLYKPIAENDTNKVCAIMAYYRKVYITIGLVILTLGLGITPFIPNIIKGGWPNSINIFALYILYLLNTSVSYLFFAYKTSLLNALQRLDLTKKAYSIVNTLQCILQLASLVLAKNYYFFVGSTIIGTALKNWFVSRVASKNYAQYICGGTLDALTKKSILRRVKGLMICNISSVTYTTFDSIIISSMIGLTAVAVYNNYIIIFNAVASIIVLIRNSMEASVGNSVASETIEKNYNDVYKWQFFFSAIAIWCSACLLNLYQPFMRIWMGDKFLLPMVDVLLLTTWFYVSTVQHAFYLYLTAAGLWLEMKWAYVLSSFCNIVLNIMLCNLIGTTGIILSTLMTTFAFGTIWQCTAIFKCYFNKSAMTFLGKQLIYTLVGGVVCLLSFVLCNFVEGNLIIEMIIKVTICSVVFGAVYLLVFGRSSIYKECMSYAQIMIKK